MPSLLYNRKQVSIEIEVGGGHRIACTCTGDLTILVGPPMAPSHSRINLRDVRVVPGFGSNLLSGPRMVKAGWSLTQQDGIFTAHDNRRHVVFSIPADFRGLYYLSGSVISRSPPPAERSISTWHHAKTWRVTFFPHRRWKRPG